MCRSCCFYIFYWAWAEQARQLGINDRPEVGESKDKLELASVSHRLQFHSAGDLQLKLALFTELPTNKSWDSKMLKEESVGAGVAAHLATAPYQQGKSADEDEECRLQHTFRMQKMLFLCFEIFVQISSHGQPQPIIIIRKSNPMKQSSSLTKLAWYKAIL